MAVNTVDHLTTNKSAEEQDRYVLRLVTLAAGRWDLTGKMKRAVGDSLLGSPVTMARRTTCGQLALFVYVLVPDEAMMREVKFALTQEDVDFIRGGESMSLTEHVNKLVDWFKPRFFEMTCDLFRGLESENLLKLA